MKRRYAACAVIFVALMAATALFAQQNPFLGAWKLDLAKTKFNPGPAPKSQLRTFEPSGKVTVKDVSATGKHISFWFIVRPDGKSYPTSGTMINGASRVTSKRINVRTIEVRYKRRGRQVERVIFRVSRDGKTLTMLGKGTLPNGTAFNNVIVFEKQ